MTSTPIELGALLDDWVASNRVGVVETAKAITISRLDAISATELLAIAQKLGWDCGACDSAGEPVSEDKVDEEFGPFVATIQKRLDGADRRILTSIGVVQALSENCGGGVWQVASAHVTFATGTTSFSPWGAGDVFAPATVTKSPLDIVREASEARLVPPDIRKWLVRGAITDDLWHDIAFQTFAAASAPALVRSLASEVAGKQTVIFNGPPRLNLALHEDRLIAELDNDGYRNLRDAVAWVYEDAVSAEQRHALFAAELSRSSTRNEPIGEVFRAAGRDVLDGARLAFQLSQSDLSREAIKAQGDLRRAIADDMSKAVEGTRSLAGAIAVAIATGITLVAARSSGTTEPWVLSLVACVVASYLFVVAASGWAYLHVQRVLRHQWRNRFYRFVPDEDYYAMVTKPTRSAEYPYHVVAVIALIVAGALVWMAFTVLRVDPSQRMRVNANTSDVKAPISSTVPIVPTAKPN